MKISWSPTSRAKPISVGDHHHRHAGGGEILHHLKDLTNQLGVQRGGRLIEEHELRIHRQGAGDRHPLLLTTGELGGVVVEPVPQPHPLQQLDAAFAGLGLRSLLDQDRCPP